MRSLRRTTAMVALLAAACTGEAITGPGSISAPAAPEATQTTTITGFVVVHGENDVRLFTDGREVQLHGATEAVIPHAGLQVSVAGWYLNSGAFWVTGMAAPKDNGPGDQF